MIDWLPAILSTILLLFIYIALPRVFLILTMGIFFALLLKPLVVKIQKEWRLSGAKSTAVLYGFIVILLVMVVMNFIQVKDDKMRKQARRAFFGGKRRAGQ